MDPLVNLVRLDEIPLHRQLVEQLRLAVLDGRIPPGTRLPSTRELAVSLGVSRTSAVAAYDELVAQGYIEGRPGSGTFVTAALRGAIGPPTPPSGSVPSPVPASHPRWLRQEPPPRQVVPDPLPGAIEFRPGKASIAPLPPSVWARVWREVGAHPPPGDYGPPGGDPELRAEIARYLGLARGMRRDPPDVTITTGAVQAIDLIARATLRPGDPVGFEEPGAPAARTILLARGARVVPLPVDDDGLCVDRLPTGPAAPLLVYVTPSHQYPLGGRLPIARRLALLDWARREDALIVEDDYDRDFRFGAPPLPALAGLDAGTHVAYVGTFSKVLTPALRTGYLVAPPRCGIWSRR